ncbi:hypothetical protein WJX75_006580 [Coccomyxa subellipsoidea]|uniref:PD-(D/E)XK endonuclease-like domain-containing protein n=1 Tax=Coccomyxa subellipsoidea TaxID=248742 RepID=A0ABR2YS29_9CHLO
MGLKVTDFTSAEWCQQQFALALTAELPREVTETEAMSAGSVLHKALELEVKTVVEVEVASREDAWALRLIECIVCLRQLMRKGMTRELYVFGKLQGHWVKGIIDELQLDELGKVRIVEHKTRRNSSVPSQAQKDTARLQVMLYRSLLQGLTDACDAELGSEILALHRLDGKAQLSKEVMKHSRTHKIALIVNLNQLLGSLRATALKLPPCSEEMQVKYLWQEDGSVLGCMDVWWDAEFLERQFLRDLHLCKLTVH